MTDVVYVVERFPELSQTFIQNEIRELRRQFGLKPRIFALYPAALPDPSAVDLAYELLPSAGHHPAGLVGAVCRTAARHPIGLTRALVRGMARPSRLQFHSLAKAVLLAARLGSTRPDRIHAHFARASASTAMLAAVVLGCRFSFTSHAFDLFVEPFDLDRKLQTADVPITVCEYNRRFIEERWPEAAGTVVVIPCGVDPDAFARRTPYRRDPFTVVAVGRLVEKKGFATLLEAASRLPAMGVDLQVRIIGEGPERPRLEERVQELGLEQAVTIEGALSPLEVREAMNRASIFCLPAVIAENGDRDSQPVVIKEALAMELPVVASDVVGIPEMVDSEVGALVAPDDASALAGALAAMAHRDEDELRALGCAGRARVVTRFSLQRQAAAIVGAWARRPGLPP